MLALNARKLGIVGAGSICLHAVVQGIGAGLACNGLQCAVAGGERTEGVQAATRAAAQLQQLVKVGRSVLHAAVQGSHHPGA
jgi:hypothetical protein